MQYLVQLNLQQKAALSAAISFWERKDVKNRMKEFLSIYDKLEINNAKQEWCRFIKATVKEWIKDLLPPSLEVELIHVIKEMGEKIFNWYKYIADKNISHYEPRENGMNNRTIKLLKNVKDFFTKNNYKKYCLFKRNKKFNENWDIDLMDQICWTPFGTLDEVKILTPVWLENANFNNLKLFNLACSYALEDHINNLSSKLPNSSVIDHYYNIFESIDRYIMAYWLHESHYTFILLPGLFPHVASRGHSEEEKIFRLSVYHGYNIAMKYFWDKLTEEEKNKNVLESARLAVRRYNYYVENERKDKEYQEYIKIHQDCNAQRPNNQDLRIGCHKKEKYIEICIFLMNKMTGNHKKIFFNEKIESHYYYYRKIDVKDEVLKMLLFAWPWQELFIPVLEDILQYQDHHTTMDGMFLYEITNKMIEDHELGYSVEMSKYRSLLREAWLLIPRAIKRKTISECVKKDLICNLIDVWDLNNLKLILNDPGSAIVRDQLIDFAFRSYKQFILKDQFERLDQLIEEVFIFRSEVEKKNFKQSIFFMKRNECLSEKMLSNRIYFLSEVKKVSWSAIKDYYGFSRTNTSLYQQLIDSKKFHIVNKFIHWAFETETETKENAHHSKCV